MKTRFAKLCFVTFAALLVSACDPDAGSVNDDASPGRADFSVFVAVGDSLTAGYADGALYRQIQENSYPLILAQQIAEAGGGEFLQPLMKAAATGSLTLGGNDLTRPDRVVFGATGDPDSPVAPETIKPTRSTAIDLRLENNGGYHNIGVPGAKSFHLEAMGYGELTLPAIAILQTANPYFARFASSNVASMVDDAAGLAPTFFILWIGANDILLYALDGGSTNNALPPYGTASTDITDPALFSARFNAALARLKTPSNTGLVINVPDLAMIPHFNFVPYNPIPMSAADAATANAAYATYNGFIAGAPISNAEKKRRTIEFKEGDNNALVITDNDSLTTVGLLPNIRQATKNDFIILASSTKIGEEATPGDPATIWGVGTALLDADVLTELEYQQVETARKAYNNAIKAAADADDDILFFDVAARLVELNQTGILYGTGGVTAEFGTGGFFSLDGVHPTARGYAVIANEIMDVLEQGFGATIPPVNPGDYTTVFYQ